MVFAASQPRVAHMPGTSLLQARKLKVLLVEHALRLMRGVRQAVPPCNFSAGLKTSILLNVNSNLYKLVRDKRANRVTVVFRIDKQILHQTTKHLPVVVLSTIHSLLSCLQSFSKTSGQTAGGRCVLTRWCCCTAVSISIAAVSWRRIEPGFPPDRTLRRRCRRGRFRSRCTIRARCGSCGSGCRRWRGP
jgi:hypothetical protein